MKYHTFAAKFLCVTMAVCLILSTASAQAGDSFSPLLEEFYLGFQTGKSIRLTLSAALNAWVPYGEATIQAMNQILSDCNVEMAYQSAADGEKIQSQLNVGDKTAFSITQKNAPQYFLAQTSLFPQKTLVSAKSSPLWPLFQEEIPISFENYQPNLDLLAELIPVALQSLESFAQDKKISYKIASVGTAKKAIVYTVPVESGELLRDTLLLLTTELPWPEIPSLLLTMALKSTAVVTLYQSADGVNMGLSIKGDMSFENAAEREVNLLWGFSNSDAKRIHTLSVKSPAVEGSDAYTLNGKLTKTITKGKNTLEAELDITEKRSKVTTNTLWTGKAVCSFEKESQHITGDIRKTVKQGETSSELSITPDISLVSSGDSVSCQGSMGILWTKNKDVQGDIVLSISAGDGGEISWDDPSEMIDVDIMGEAQLAELQSEARNNAARSTIEALLALPKEQLTLFSEGISQEVWTNITKSSYQVEE